MYHCKLRESGLLAIRKAAQLSITLLLLYWQERIHERLELREDSKGLKDQSWELVVRYGVTKIAEALSCCSNREAGIKRWKLPYSAIDIHLTAGFDS